MSDTNQARASSKTPDPPTHGPGFRSRYEKNQKLDLETQLPELYKVGDPVYVKGARGIDPNPYKVHKILGNGQYHLSRDGKSDRKVYRQENLQKEP